MTDNRTAPVEPVGGADVLQDRERSFALAVDDMTEHDAVKESGGVTVRIDTDTPSGATTLNTLGELARAYEMQFYTGALTDGTNSILRFGEDRNP